MHINRVTAQLLIPAAILAEVMVIITARKWIIWVGYNTDHRR